MDPEGSWLPISLLRVGRHLSCCVELTGRVCSLFFFPLVNIGAFLVSIHMDIIKSIRNRTDFGGGGGGAKVLFYTSVQGLPVAQTEHPGC